VIYQTRVSCRSVLIGSRKEESTKLSTNARCILIHRERWSGLPAELVLVALQVSIIFLVLMWRIDYAGSTVNNPIWTEPQQFSPFMPDEVSYISGRMVRFISLSDVLLNYLENPVNVNLWGDFIFFLSQRGFKWVQIVWINIVGYFVFVAVLLSLLDNLVRNSAYGFLIFAIITFNPGLFQISVSSIRDIWILVFLVASILSLRKKLYVLAVLFTILLGILRTYMTQNSYLLCLCYVFQKKVSLHYRVFLIDNTFCESPSTNKTIFPSTATKRVFSEICREFHWSKLVYDHWKIQTGGKPHLQARDCWKLLRFFELQSHLDYGHNQKEAETVDC